MTDKTEEMITRFAEIMTEEHGEIVAALQVNKDVEAQAMKIEALESFISWIRWLAGGVGTGILVLTVWFAADYIALRNQVTEIHAVLDDASDDLDNYKNVAREIYATKDDVEARKVLVEALLKEVLRDG